MCRRRASGTTSSSARGPSSRTTPASRRRRRRTRRASTRARGARRTDEPAEPERRGGEQRQHDDALPRAVHEARDLRRHDRLRHDERGRDASRERVLAVDALDHEDRADADHGHRQARDERRGGEPPRAGQREHGAVGVAGGPDGGLGRDARRVPSVPGRPAGVGVLGVVSARRGILDHRPSVAPEAVRPVANSPREARRDSRLRRRAAVVRARRADDDGVMTDSPAPRTPTVTVTDEGDRFEARTDDGVVAGLPLTCGSRAR